MYASHPKVVRLPFYRFLLLKINAARANYVTSPRQSMTLAFYKVLTKIVEKTLTN